MNLDDLSDRLESLESAHGAHSEMKASLDESLARLSDLRKQVKAYAAFGIEPLKVQLPIIRQANIASYKAGQLWKEIQELAGLAPYEMALSKVAKLTMLVAGAGKSKVLRSKADASAIYAGSLSDMIEAYRQAVKLCFKLRKGKRTMRERSIIDHNAFVAWKVLWLGLKQVKRLIAIKQGDLYAARITDRHYAALHNWAKVQGVTLSTIANPSEQWEIAGRLNGRVYVIHNALSDTPISKKEKAKVKLGASLPVVPEVLDELRHGVPHREVKVVVKGKIGMQRTILVNRL